MLVIILQYNVIGMTGSMIAMSIDNTIGNIHLHIYSWKLNTITNTII